MKTRNITTILRVSSFCLAVSASFAFMPSNTLINFWSKNVHSLQCLPIMSSQVPQRCDQWGSYA